MMGRHVTDFGDGCVAFPAGNGLFVDPNLVSNLLLGDLEIQPPRMDMFV